MSSALAIDFGGDNFSTPPSFSPRKDSTLAERFQCAIIHLSVKQLARAAQCSNETAKSWKKGKAVPYAPHLFALAKNVDEVRNWVLFESDPNAGVVQAIALLQQQAMLGGQEGAIARAKLNNIMAAARGV